MSKDQVFNSADFGEFDIVEKTKDKKNFAAIVVGQRRTGKSHMLRELLSKVKHYYKEAYVFCETIKLQPQLFDYIPKNNQYESFDQASMEKLWHEQENYIKRELSKDPEADKSKMDYKLFIFDDCIADPKFRSSPILNRFFTQGRHINLAVVILSQTISGKWGVNGVCMNNCDFFISFYLKAQYCRETCIAKYLSIKDIKEGNEVFKEMTKEKYRAMVVDNTEMSQAYSDFVYTYKAQPKTKSFKIGADPKDHDTIFHLGITRQTTSKSKNKKVANSGLNYNIILN